MTISHAVTTRVRERHAWHIPRQLDAVAAPPLLEGGDWLTRPEFERRYQAMPHIKKAELIEGVVYMPSPVRFSHGKPHSQMIGWLTTYWAATPGVDVCDNTTIRLDMDNEPQPDALLRLDSALGGQSYISDDDYIEGAPELIAEIALSSASYDLHAKKNAYRRNVVQEYLVWRVYDQKLDWFRWRAGEYVPMEPDEDGVIRSEIFPGLHLDIPAMLRGDLAQVLLVLQQGLETDEHKAFIEQLQK